MEHTVWTLKTGEELKKAADGLVKYLGTCEGSASSHIREARQKVDFLTTRVASRGRVTKLSIGSPAHPVEWEHYVKLKCPYCGISPYKKEADVFSGSVRRLHYSCSCLEKKVFYVQFGLDQYDSAKYRMFCVDLEDDLIYDYEAWRDYWLRTELDQRSRLADEIFRGRAEWANWCDNVRLVEFKLFPKRIAGYVLFPTTDVGEGSSYRYSIGVTGGELSYGYYYAGFSDYVDAALRIRYVANNNPLFECRTEDYVLPEASTD